MIACFGSPAVFGSVISFLVGGGILYALANITLRTIPFTRDRNIFLISFFFYSYFFFQLISSIYNYSFHNDFRDLLSNITFLMIPIFYSFISIVDKREIMKAGLDGCAFSCLAAFLVAIFEFYGLHSRAEALAGNPIVFGMMTGLTAAIVLAGAFSAVGRRRNMFLLAFGAGAVAMFLSGTKIMWIALFVCLVVILVIYRKQLVFRPTTMKGAAVLCCALVFGGLAFDPVVDRMENFMHDVATVDATDANAVSYRLAVWKVGIRAALEEPIFGHGVGASKGIIERGLDREIGKTLNYTHFHNGFLTALVETGIFGALSLYGAFLATAYVAIQSQRRAKTEIETFGSAMLLLTVATYLVCGMVGILVGHDIIDVVLLLCLVVGTHLGTGKDTVLVSQPAKSAIA